LFTLQNLLLMILLRLFLGQTAWIEASQVLFDEVNSIRSIRASGNWNAGASHHSPPDERPILGLIGQAVGAMTDYSANIPLTSEFYLDLQ
jgi:hypothetical protein